jgi:hypothetical protein
MYIKGNNMFASTRKFIKQRQSFSKYVVEKVNVRQIGGGLENDCFNNAYKVLDREKGIRIVSGWIIEPFNALTNSTEIVQHWWNIDRNGNYFDTTFTNHNAEYIVDSALAEFTNDFYDDINSCVGSSLLLKDNCFYRVKIDGEDIHFFSIDNLATKNFYFENGQHLFTTDRTMPYHSYLFDEAA